MKSVTTKTNTLRRAAATARVRAAPQAIERLNSNDLPKRDPLPIARAAGTLAAKRTSDIIPYCHPVPVDSIEISFEVREECIDVSASVEAIWKTGVEMEALTAASVAALTLYDMLKPLDAHLTIESVKLDSKRGGKREFPRRAPKGVKAAVIVTSDGVYGGTREDRSGKLICEHFESYGVTPSCEVLPDDEERIVESLLRLCAGGVNLVVTTGGTGLGPRDVTVEATRRVIERELPGVVEAARAYGQSRTPYAMLSRGVAGVRGKTVIVNLPGSSRGADETMSAIFPGIFHALAMVEGAGH